MHVYQELISLLESKLQVESDNPWNIEIRRSIYGFFSDLVFVLRLVL